MLVNIGKRVDAKNSFAFFEMGFRPFFLGASCYSVISILIWVLYYSFGSVDLIKEISPFVWHAHEMIFGYTFAVIAGFLLTAVSNWTGIKTASGFKLLVIFLFWCFARIFFLSTNYRFSLLFDLLFNVLLLIYIAQPIIKVKQYKQLGILTKIFLMLVCNILSYLEILNILNLNNLGIYLGLYLVIATMLTIGTRVLPTFITAGLDLDKKIESTTVLSIIGLIFYIIFCLNEFLFSNEKLAMILLGILFFSNLWRLTKWYHPRIWEKPLLWSLYLSFVFVDIGFLLLLLSKLGVVSKFLAIHSFTYGGIGLATLSMMSRVTLGHTGRSIKNPPNNISYYLLIFCFGIVIRVFLPIALPQYYFYWIIISQIIWIIAFSCFVKLNQSMLIQAVIS